MLSCLRFVSVADESSGVPSTTGGMHQMRRQTTDASSSSEISAADDFISNG